MEKIGLHVSRVHYYSPIPDTRSLSDGLWEKKSDLMGIDINEDAQLNLLDNFKTNYKSEYDSFPKNKQQVDHDFYLYNGFFESVDAEILYSMIRHFKPRRIIEIGSGYSTYLSAKAIHENRQENQEYECDLTAIEPYPNETLRKGFPGLSKIIMQKVQDVPLDEFDELQNNDILFIDSSHVLHVGSDVQYEYLEILPRLKKGVLVHLHDIFLPEEYPKNWVKEALRFWNEQYVLQAFLIFNDNFECLWGSHYMSLNHPEKLCAAFSSYNGVQKGLVRMSSFWIKRK